MLVPSRHGLLAFLVSWSGCIGNGSRLFVASAPAQLGHHMASAGFARSSFWDQRSEQPKQQRRQAGHMAVDIIQQIMPKSVSCTGATLPADCATATTAAPYLIDAMQKYGLFQSAQIAGVLALVAYESDQMEFRHNVYPGTPGQGTSNMQSVQYNAKYAASIPELAAGLAAAGSDPNAILALVTPDQYNFGSGPWFLATQCSDDVRAKLATGTDDGFRAYMSCVGADVSEAGRMDLWHTALAAFGL